MSLIYKADPNTLLVMHTVYYRRLEITQLIKDFVYTQAMEFKDLAPRSRVLETKDKFISVTVSLDNKLGHSLMLTNGFGCILHLKVVENNIATTVERIDSILDGMTEEWKRYELNQFNPHAPCGSDDPEDYLEIEETRVSTYEKQDMPQLTIQFWDKLWKEDRDYINKSINLIKSKYNVQ